MGKKLKGVSIIICCYNSSKRLPETLKQIANQDITNDIPCELIVVNNASKDNTAEVAVLEWNKHNSNLFFQVINQPILGKNHALKKGLETAVYDYLIICDDDNWLQKDYVKKAYDIMEKHPEVGIAGGRGEAVFEGNPPNWFDEYKEHFGVGSQAKYSGYVSHHRNWVYGAGSVIRKSAWQTLMTSGFNSILVGPMGSRFSGGGEDIELCYAMKLAGYEIWYEDELRFLHFMPKERLNWKYFLRLMRTTSCLFVTLTAYQKILNGTISAEINGTAIRLIIFKMLYNHIKRLLRNIAKRCFQSLQQSEANKIDLDIIRSLTVVENCCFRFKKIEKNFFKVLSLARRFEDISEIDTYENRNSHNMNRSSISDVM
jgi:glycosyltransferase involved in cell wall biosynthesis